MEQQLPEGNTKNLKKGRKKRNEMKKKNGQLFANNESAIHQSPFQGNGELKPRFNLYSISSNIRTSVQFTVYKIRTKKI
jgi:hypothetical protein